MKYIIFSILFLLVIAWLAGYRWNHSDSFPIGIWKITKSFNNSTDKFKIVIFCPPDTPLFKEAKSRDYLKFGILSCAHGYQPMIKRVVAVSGDRIMISKEGIKINGVLQKNSKLLAVDSKQRYLPQSKNTTMPYGMVWLLSDYSQQSFDSRYFGPIPISSIIGVMQPIIISPINFTP